MGVYYYWNTDRRLSYPFTAANVIIRTIIIVSYCLWYVNCTDIWTYVLNTNPVFIINARQESCCQLLSSHELPQYLLNRRSIFHWVPTEKHKYVKFFKFYGANIKKKRKKISWFTPFSIRYIFLMNNIIVF